MTQQRDEAFVLATQELGEADLIVSLLTENHGAVRGVARAARKSRRRFGGRLEPLTRVGLVWSAREGRDLHRIDAVEGLRSYAEMQSDPALQAACAALAEIAAAFTHPGQADPDGFRLLAAVLDAFESGGDLWVVLRYYEFWMLRLHGLLPELNRCASCSADLSAHASVRSVGSLGLVCSRCSPDCSEPDGC